MDFTEPVNDEDYYTKEDFADRPNSDWFDGKTYSVDDGKGWEGMGSIDYHMD